MARNCCNSRVAILEILWNLERCPINSSFISSATKRYVHPSAVDDLVLVECFIPTCYFPMYIVACNGSEYNIKQVEDRSLPAVRKYAIRCPILSPKIANILCRQEDKNLHVKLLRFRSHHRIDSRNLNLKPECLNLPSPP